MKVDFNIMRKEHYSVCFSPLFWPTGVFVNFLILQWLSPSKSAVVLIHWKTLCVDVGGRCNFGMSGLGVLFFVSASEQTSVDSLKATLCYFEGKQCLEFYFLPLVVYRLLWLRDVCWWREETGCSYQREQLPVRTWSCVWFSISSCLQFPTAAYSRHQAASVLHVRDKVGITVRSVFIFQSPVALE